MLVYIVICDIHMYELIYVLLLVFNTIWDILQKLHYVYQVAPTLVLLAFHS